MCKIRGLLFCRVTRPTPPATWDAASQIAPCGAGKKQRKRKYFAPPFHKKYAQVLCPQGHHLGLNALCLRGGMGAEQAPYPATHVANLRSVCAGMEMKERVNQKRDSCKSSSSGSIRRRRGSSGCTAFCPSSPARMVCALAMTESGIPASRAT